MKLIDVHHPSCQDEAHNTLFDLLKERPAEANISHSKMPSWREHLDFIASRPYFNWYIIEVQKARVGAVYLTKDKEIGIAIFRIYSGKGYATKAIRKIMAIHKGPFKANIAPHNGHSIHLFKKLGFKPLQYVYISD